jgi:DEAD/DEAH box helicase
LAGPGQLSELAERIADPDIVAEDPFGLLRDVSHAYVLAEAEVDGPDLVPARELIIRLTEYRDRMGSAVALHDSLLARIGLFPYLREAELAGSDLFAYEAHRPEGDFGEGLVWHRRQAEAYALLMDGKNVILSAPTSFGKSRVIDGLLASGDYSQVMVIVPTIALIDETRRRLAKLLGDRFKVITHVDQAPAERTVYVLTQERVLEFEEIPDLDLFVVDEFYKLALDEDDPDRTRLLNQAFHRLLTTGAQFYLLGPNVGGIGKDTLDKLDNCVWIDSWDTTIAVDVIATKKSHAKYKRLRQIAGECEQRGEKTLIYCYRPSTAEKVAIELLEAGIGTPGTGAADAAEWLGSKVHPRWRVARALAGGIGVHHGQLPRAFGHYLVNAFDSGEVNFLICTSTMIEGVNTKGQERHRVRPPARQAEPARSLYLQQHPRPQWPHAQPYIWPGLSLQRRARRPAPRDRHTDSRRARGCARRPLPRHARGGDGGLDARASRADAPRVSSASSCPRSDPSRQCRGSAQGRDGDPGATPRVGGESLVE